MRRNLKALGLALAAIFAMSALVAQGAQAVETTEHTFNSEVEKTVLTGGFDTGFKDRFKAGNATLVCNSAKFEGTVPTKTADTVTVTPTYGSTTATPSGCEVEGAKTEVIVHTNHCAYVFDSDTVLTTKEPEEQEHAPVEIECSGETENEITITAPSVGVTLHLQAQKPSHGVRYTNIGEGNKREITVHTTAKNISGKCTGANCFLLGLSNYLETKKEFTTAEYNGTETIAGFKDEGTELTGTEKTTPTFNEGTTPTQVGVFLTTP